MINYIVAAVESWNRSLFDEKINSLSGNWHFVATPSELNELTQAGLSPRYIFFPHWRWIVPTSITDNFECVCFHMTDVPFGRGGSPLQNLISRGYSKTVLTALKMDKGMDSGPVYMKRPLDLSGPASEIYMRAAKLSWTMIEDIILANPIPQEQKGPVVEFRRRKPEESKIPPNLDPNQIFDFIRMLDADGYPKAFMIRDNYRLEFDSACKIDGEVRASVTIKIEEKKV